MVLKLDKITKRYGEFVAVRELSLAVETGEIYGLLGPNGAGKTSSIRVILQFHEADSGMVSLFGQQLGQCSAAIRQQLGYLPGDVHFDAKPTGQQFLDFLGRFHEGFDRDRQRALIERLKFDPSKAIFEYSKGNRQKLGIIAALQHWPKLIIMDEASTGLDPLMQQIFYEILRDCAKKGAAILLSSHILSEVQQICDRVGIMRQGQLVFEKPVEKLTQEAVRRMTVVFAGEAPDDFALEGLTLLNRQGRRFEFLAEAEADSIVKALSKYELDDFIFEKASLEDLFLKLYGTS